MLQHLLYVASPGQIAEIREALSRLGAQVQNSDVPTSERYLLAHRMLDSMQLSISLLDNLGGVTAHLRQYPVDLLIYDERGGSDAIEALPKIRDDVLAFAQLWGPDFLFPMSRLVVILGKHQNEAKLAFSLGQFRVRDVLVGPGNAGQIIRWLRDILKRGVMRENKVGVAFSGGGLDGFLHHLGSLLALEVALAGRKLADADAFSGISSGAIAAGLHANGVPIKEIIRAIYGTSQVFEPVKSGTLFELAGKDIAQRLLTETLSWAGFDPSKWVKKFFRSVPTGIFRGESIEKFVREAIEKMGKSNDFRELEKILLVGATDQDSFKHTIFGSGFVDTVPISQSIAASCSFPPIFTPVSIDGRYYMDGQVTKTCNPDALVALGCRLVFILDPVQPLATQVPGSVDKQGGVYSLIQVIKALVYTRFHNSIMHLTERYPDVDFIILQPDENTAELMAGSPMRYRLRKEIIEAAFRGTLRRLRERHHVYSTILSKYGFEISPRKELLDLERKYHEFPESLD